MRLRREVASFAALMEAAIRSKEKRYGREGWKTARPSELWEHFREEVAEFERAEGDRLLWEAVDVANLAMMLADRLVGTERTIC